MSLPSCFLCSSVSKNRQVRISVRKLFIILLSILVLLSGCGFVGMAPDGPESLQIDNKIYKTGFYGSLFPNRGEYSFTGLTLQIDDLSLARIVHDTFELYHADVGPYSEGTVYCAESQFEQAVTYYSNPANYTYFCILGPRMSDGTTDQTVEFPNVDVTIFNDLLSFSEQSCYDPFDNRHNSEVKTVDLPMPDDTVDTRMVFYKESNDSMFCSSHAHDFYILDNTLYVVYRYEFGPGDDEKLIAVKVPENISTYFVSLMRSEGFL